MCDFKKTFRKYLKLALTQYPTAKIKEQDSIEVWGDEEQDNKGFWLHNSSSPIERKTRYHLGLAK